MGWFIAIVLAVSFIVYANDKKFIVKRLKKENEELREIIKKLQTARTSVQTTAQTQPAQTIVTASTSNETKTETQKQETEEEIRRKHEEKERVERERKNTNILVVGAILIVLAAIVFLMSTWNSIGSFIKAVILGLFVFIFLGLSKIAKEQYNLKKAGMAFFYIGMAYIPICLISFSVFGLVGSYFSLEGEGKYIYYAVSFIITSGIYYINYKNLNSKVLFIGTISSQLLSIVLFLLTFENNIFMILTALLGYNLILLNMKFSDEESQIIKVLNLGIPYISAALLVTTFMEVSNWKLASMILLGINLYFNKTKTELDSYLLNADIYGLNLYLAFLHFGSLNDSISIIIATGMTIIIFLIEYMLVPMDNKAIRRSGSILAMLSIVLLFFKSIYLRDEIVFIKPYVFSIIEMIIMAITYREEDDLFKEVLELLIPILAIITCADIVYEHINTAFAYFVLGMIVFALAEIVTLNNKRFENKIKLIGNVYVALTFVSLAGYAKEEINTVFYVLCLFIVNGYNYIKIKKNYKEEALLIYPLIMPLICISIINPELKTVIYAFLALLVIAAALMKRKISVETVIGAIYLIAALAKVDSIYIKYLIGIIWAIVNIFFVETKKEKDVFRAISYVFVYLIYNNLLIDYFKTEYKTFELAGTLILVVALTRTILKNYIKDIDAIEYIALGILYLYAIGDYYNELDGIMFVTIIIFLMFISYYKKYGAIFIVSLIAILANAILLTREFWLSIPWWIYLLAVGSILILFAVKNESDENKFKGIKPQDIIKNIKDRVESDK